MSRLVENSVRVQQTQMGIGEQRYGPAGRWRIGCSVLIKIFGMDSPSADDPKSLHGRILRGSTEYNSPRRRYNTRFEKKNDEGFPRISIICYAYNTKNTRTNQRNEAINIEYVSVRYRTSNTQSRVRTVLVPVRDGEPAVRTSTVRARESFLHYYSYSTSSNSVIRFDRAGCRTFLMRLPADPLLVPSSA